MNNRESGFGIIESLLVLAIILTVTTSLNQYFVSARDEVVIRKARLQLEEDLVRLMMITEENTVCERLSFIGKVNLQETMSGTGTELDRIEIDGVTVIEKSPANSKARYRINKIVLKQDSNVYAQFPKRALASLTIEADFYRRSAKGLTGDAAKFMGSKVKKSDSIRLVLAGGNGNSATVGSCYGSFSRRISCVDKGWNYEPGRPINCVNQ